MFEYKALDLLQVDENINIQKYVTQEKEPEHTHDFIEIVYIISGTGEHKVNNRSFGVERGDIVFINFRETHSFYSIDGMEIVNFIIKAEFISKELIDSENAFEILTLTSFEDLNGKVDRLIPKVSFRGRELIEIENIIATMIKEFNEKSTGYKTILKGYLNVLLAKIFREMRNLGIGQIFKHENKITPEILKYIEEKCFEEITLKELAQKSFYNPSYFSKIFKECFGKTLTEFVLEKRINEAIRLLEQTDMSVENICFNVGYKEKKQFYKIFKEYTGVTPSNIRNKITN
jgi:AraC family transcriptional regulator, L-rhamnose operon transcriptional activator RhaR